CDRKSKCVAIVDVIYVQSIDRKKVAADLRDLAVEGLGQYRLPGAAVLHPVVCSLIAYEIGPDRNRSQNHDSKDPNSHFFHRVSLRSATLYARRSARYAPGR